MKEEKNQKLQSGSENKFTQKVLDLQNLIEQTKTTSQTNLSPNKPADQLVSQYITADDLLPPEPRV